MANRLWQECEPGEEGAKKFAQMEVLGFKWLRPAPDYRALLELARTNPHRFIGTEHSCKLCGNEAGDVIHRAAYRALAVELARALQHYHGTHAAHGYYRLPCEEDRGVQVLLDRPEVKALLKEAQ